MVNSLLIGEIIYQQLISNTSIAAAVGTKVFPLIANMGTTFPYIAFSQTDIQPRYSKDGNYMDAVRVEIVVVHTDYFKMLGIANTVRSIFDKTQVGNNNLKIVNGELEGVTEEYDDTSSAFAKRLTFVFEVI